MPRTVSDTHELQQAGESAPPQSTPVLAGRTLHKRLVDALCQLPEDSTMSGALATLLNAFSDVLPGYALAVTMTATALDDAVLLRVPALDVPPDAPWSDDPRMFPMFAHERRIPIAMDGAEIHFYCAYNDPALDHPDSSIGQSLKSCADVMAAGVRHVQARRLAAQAAAENEQMRAMLIQNEKLASLGEIAAGLVHELSNPLTSIVAYTDYLRQKAERRGSDPEDVERLRRVGEAADLILSFTRAIIAYARPATDPPATVSVGEIVEQAFLFCKHFVDQSGVVVRRDVPLDLPRVHAVRGQLTQVVVNLVTNACQAMEATGGELLLEATLDQEAQLVVLRVADTGPGIAKGDMPNVFDPFFTTKSAGTGLGLNIVRQIVERHGGCITVESSPGQGATFIVALPVAL